jgi:hypothetical protein
MQAEMKRKASRVTCRSWSAAPTLIPVPTGAKKIRVWVDTTPNCLTGRMASMWSRRLRVPLTGMDGESGDSVTVIDSRGER